MIKKTIDSSLIAVLILAALCAAFAASVTFRIGETSFWTYSEAAEVRTTCFWLSALFVLSAAWVYFQSIPEQLGAACVLLLLVAAAKPNDLMKRRADELIYPAGEEISSLLFISDVPTEGLQNYRRFVLNFNRALSVVVERVRAGIGVDFAGEPGDVIGQSLELYGRGISKINSDPTVQKAREAAGEFEPATAPAVDPKEPAE